MMSENKAFKIAGIKNLITRNYKLPADALNLEDLIDSSIGMSENWHNKIKELVFRLLDSQDRMRYESL